MSIARLRRLPRPALILALAVALTMGLVATRPVTPAAPPPEKSWPVDVLPVKRDVHRPTLQLYGLLQAVTDAQISAGIDGEVREVLVSDGQLVAAGDPLVVLDDRDVMLTLLQREVDVRDIRSQFALEQRRLARHRQGLAQEEELLNLSRQNAGRARELFRQGLISQADVDKTAESLTRQELAVNARELTLDEGELRLAQLQAQLQRAEALRDQARLAAERTRIIAPFAGMVSGVTVSQGDRVRTAETLLRLYDPVALELRAQLPSSYAARVRDGLTAGMDMDARIELDGRSYLAQLRRVSGQTREGSGSVDIYLGFVDGAAPASPRVGAIAQLLLSLPPEGDAIALPAEALYGSDRVYRVTDNRMESVQVERIGERLLPDGRTEIIVRSAQLADGDTVVTTRLPAAGNGLLVRPAPADGLRESALAASPPGTGPTS